MLIELEQLMVEFDDDDSFKRFFILFACVTFIAPTALLEAHYALWHAPVDVLLGQVNWSKFLLEQMIERIYEFS